MVKGSKISEKVREKMKLAQSKNKFWLGKKHSEESKEKMRKIKKEIGFIPGTGFKKGNKFGLGRHHSKEVRLKLSLLHKGKKCIFWKGGVSKINEKIRKSIDYRLWRETVFARDNWTCQKYGTRGGRLHPHHIKNFSQHPELRFAIYNGITLSETAHREFHKKYGQKNNTQEQLLEFLDN